MNAREDWDATFIPGTSVLANKLGLTDPDELAAAEYGITALREAMLAAGSIAVDRTYDAGHLRAIHAALFSPIYDWAGVERTYPMAKGGLWFAEPSQIGRYLDHARDHIAGVDWTGLDRGGFAVEAATVFASINMAHPYREGNGRSSKVFMSHLAERAGYGLDFERITPEQWVNASMLSRPDRGKFAPVPDSLVPVFARITTDHTAAPNAAARAARIAARGTSRQSPTADTGRGPSTDPERPRDDPGPARTDRGYDR